MAEYEWSGNGLACYRKSNRGENCALIDPVVKDGGLAWSLRYWGIAGDVRYESASYSWLLGEVQALIEASLRELEQKAEAPE